MSSTLHIRTLATRRGEIRLPAYVPVTTFGSKYPLDDLVRPYLPRLAPAVMVSYHFVRGKKNIGDLADELRVPIFVDSGGFASLFTGSRITRVDTLGVLEVTQAGDEVDQVHPRDVLELQEQFADVAFTLDFPIPPGMEKKDAQQRQQLTIANAQWALANRRRKDMLLFACVQAWDVASARTCARAYANAPFDGIAIGGLVPRAHDTSAILAIVEAVRTEIGNRPLHVFGLGNPAMVEKLFKAGVDSVDSSAYVKLAADGRLWSDPDYHIADPSPTDRLHLALCNLATAATGTLPLSASRIVFRSPMLPELSRRHAP